MYLYIYICVCVCLSLQFYGHPPLRPWQTTPFKTPLPPASTAFFVSSDFKPCFRLALTTQPAENVGTVLIFVCLFVGLRSCGFKPPAWKKKQRSRENVGTVCFLWLFGGYYYCVFCSLVSCFWFCFYFFWSFGLLVLVCRLLWIIGTV